MKIFKQGWKRKKETYVMCILLKYLYQSILFILKNHTFLTFQPHYNPYMTLVIHANCMYIVIGNKYTKTKWKLARLPKVKYLIGEENLLHLNENFDERNCVQNCVVICICILIFWMDVIQDCEQCLEIFYELFVLLMQKLFWTILYKLILFCFVWGQTKS